MRLSEAYKTTCLTQEKLIAVSVLLLMASAAAFGQAPMTDVADQNRQLNAQIADLRAQITQLQSAVQQNGSGKGMSPKSGMRMSPPAKKGMGMEGEGEMGGMSMGNDKAEMGSMAMGAKSLAAPDAAMGMCCMKKTPASNGAAMNSAPPAAMPGMTSSSSAMPGQSGVSHLYHIGSNGFFLNHSRHITLTPDQRLTLTRMKDNAMSERTYVQSKIAQQEQDLYALTGANEPDTAKIQAKIAESEKLRGDERMNYIREVGEASNVLTPEQRMVLLGTMTGNGR